MEKIEQYIIDEIKLKWGFNNPLEDIIDFMYNQKYPSYEYRRLENYKRYVYCDIESIIDKPVKDIIEYLKTVNENYILTQDRDGDFEFNEICTENDDEYIRRLVEKFQEIDIILSHKKSEKKELIKQKERLEEELKKVNRLIETY